MRQLLLILLLSLALLGAAAAKAPDGESEKAGGTGKDAQETASGGGVADDAKGKAEGGRSDANSTSGKTRTTDTSDADKADPRANSTSSEPGEKSDSKPADVATAKAENADPKEKDAGKPDATDKGASDDKGKAGDKEDVPEKGKSDETGKPEEKGKADEKGKSEENGKADEKGKSEEKGPQEKGKSEENGPSEKDAPDASGNGKSKTNEPTSSPTTTTQNGPDPAEAVLPPATPELIVTSSTGPDVVTGEVKVQALHTEASATRWLVLIRPDGREEILARNSTFAGWNATGYENDWYRLELREERPDGTNQTVASTRVLVANPRSSATQAVAAVATATVITLTSGAVAARGFDLLGLARNALLDVSSEVAEERARHVTSTRYARRVRTAVAIGVAVALLAVCRTWAATPGFDAFLASLPTAGFAVAICVAGTFGAEWALARASGARPEAHVWWPGAISLALSTVLFRSAFGMPAYVEEKDRGTTSARESAWRAIVLLLATIGLALPFVALGWVWRWDVAEYGIGVALMIAAASSLPFRPLPGKDIWISSKPLWLSVFPIPLALWMGWQLGWVPPAALAGVGLAGLAAFVAFLARRRSP